MRKSKRCWVGIQRMIVFVIDRKTILATHTQAATIVDSHHDIRAIAVCIICRRVSCLTTCMMVTQQEILQKRKAVAHFEKTYDCEKALGWYLARNESVTHDELRKAIKATAVFKKINIRCANNAILDYLKGRKNQPTLNRLMPRVTGADGKFLPKKYYTVFEVDPKSCKDFVKVVAPKFKDIKGKAFIDGFVGGVKSGYLFSKHEGGMQRSPWKDLMNHASLQQLASQCAVLTSATSFQSYVLSQKRLLIFSLKKKCSF